MFLPSLLPSVTLWFIIFLLFLITSTSAHPCPQYAHNVRSLHPTFHLLPRLWTSSNPQEPRNLPAPTTRRIQRRGLPGAVYICTKANFRGDCAWIMPDNKCHIPGTGNNSPESIGPDPDGFCVLFQSATCDGAQISTLRFPGIETQVPEFGSIQCFSDGGKNATVRAKGNATSKAKADPRLPGGFGSADALELKSVLADMEKEGFIQGMIGLKKGHYY